MASVFGWLDYSDSQRRQMLDTISLFRERTTRDELGIGTIRDAISDMLFPGTSTIQTRAKYFLLVPWTYLRVEQWLHGKQKTNAEIASRARQIEVQTIESLRANSDSTIGIIGREAGAKLQRLPSTIYWAGLRSWRIRAFEGYQDLYHQSLAVNGTPVAHGSEDSVPVAAGANWHAGLPDLPEGFPESQEIDLSVEEGSYLRDRVLGSHPRTLLAHLVALHHTDDAAAPFPWFHPEAKSVSLPLQRQLHHARVFSEVFHGAYLVYNLMLAQELSRLTARDTDGDRLVDAYRDAIESWAETVESGPFYRDWDRTDFWSLIAGTEARVQAVTRAFVNRWFDLVGSGTPKRLSMSEAAQSLIARREHQMKGSGARLKSRPALELWGGASGSQQLDYRWSTVRQIITDIVQTQDVTRA